MDAWRLGERPEDRRLRTEGSKNRNRRIYPPKPLAQVGGRQGTDKQR